MPHWGPIWVAGRTFSAGSGAQTFRIRAPGTYTLEGAPARINGRPIRPGETIRLDRGEHRFEPAGSGQARLRWGDNLHRPAYVFAGEPMFKDF